jgi:predicted RNA binding protein YcfA (HicA-like mRNA interferase family)
LVRLRVLSGKEVCAILRREGLEEVRRRGSHIVMQRKLPEGTITVPVPDHDELRIGTLHRSFDNREYPGRNLSPIDSTTPWHFLTARLEKCLMISVVEAVPPQFSHVDLLHTLSTAG